jgi:hypothetical protein
VVDAMRQGFVDHSITWAGTWPALVALAGMLAVLVYFALRGMQRTSY